MFLYSKSRLKLSSHLVLFELPSPPDAPDLVDVAKISRLEVLTKLY